jgi:tetratricopeptide (TPR) repeat protein
LVQLPAQGGDSGGAVVNDRGEVVAARSGRETPQQMVGFAVAAAEIRDFMDETRPLWRPESAADWSRRGRHFLRFGNPATARTAFSEAIRSDPMSVDARCGRSEAARRLCDPAAALADAAAAVRINPNDPAALSARAAANVARREYEQAIADASAALTIDLKCSPARLWMGEARRKLGERDAARAELDEAIWLAPNSSEAYWHRSLLEGDGKSMTDVDRAIELDPYRPEWLRHRAGLREQANDHKRAAADLERVIELDPADAAAHFGLASCYARSGETGRALSAFRRGVSALASGRPGAGEGGRPCPAY